VVRAAVAGSVLTVVRYLGVPVVDLAELYETLDAFRREVQLSILAGGEHVVDDEVAEALVASRESMVSVSNSIHRQIDAAREADLAVVDIEVEYPGSSYRDIFMVDRATWRADDAAAAGRMLTSPLRPELRDLYEWMTEQALAQIRHEPPTRFHPARPAPEVG